MEKRLPLALFLSFLILFAWSAINRRPVDPASGAGTGAAGAADVSQPAADSSSVAAPVEPEPLFGEVREAAERWTEWLELGRAGELGHYWARFDNRGGRLAELRLGGYYDAPALDAEQEADREHWAKLLAPVESTGGETGSLELRTGFSSRELVRGPLEQVLWEHELLPDRAGVRFTYAAGTGVVFEKTIRSVPGAQHLSVELSIANENAALAGPKGFHFTPAACVAPASTDSFYHEPQAVVAWHDDGEIEVETEERVYRTRELQGDFAPASGIAFVGAHSKYFAFLMRGNDESSSLSMQGAAWRRIYDEAWVREHPGEADSGYRSIVADAALQLRVPVPGQPPSVYTYEVYAGPKDRTIFVDDDPAQAALLREDLGFFSGIAGLLLEILGFFQSLTHNWGFAIIFLTLTVRLILFPVTRRSQVAMARHATKMKRVQPMLEEVKKKYAKDAQKLRQEQARIMQQEGAFPPLGGCLPMFLQIPVFIGLFSALRTSIDLRHAPFIGWIHDLSQPDHLLRIDVSLPLIGTIEWLNILPPIMVALWILQQKVMPKPTDEQAARMQRMMMWMPILFGFFLYNYAAGLSVYMITTSSLGILEQTVIKNVWPIDDRELPKKKSGFMKRLAELQEQAQQMQNQKSQAKARGGQSKGKPAKRKR